MPAFARRADPNSNANTANVIAMSFFPMIEYFLLLFRGFNTTIISKLPGNVRKDELKTKEEEQTTRNAVPTAEIGSYFLSTSGMYAS